jgi:hypothetical protein
MSERPSKTFQPSNLPTSSNLIPKSGLAFSVRGVFASEYGVSMIFQEQLNPWGWEDRGLAYNAHLYKAPYLFRNIPIKPGFGI